jgi:hypothetical protein
MYICASGVSRHALPFKGLNHTMERVVGVQAYLVHLLSRYAPGSFVFFYEAEYDSREVRRMVVHGIGANVGHCLGGSMSLSSSSLPRRAI